MPVQADCWMVMVSPFRYGSLPATRSMALVSRSGCDLGMMSLVQVAPSRVRAEPLTLEWPDDRTSRSLCVTKPHGPVEDGFGSSNKFKHLHDLSISPKLQAGRSIAESYSRSILKYYNTTRSCFDIREPIGMLWHLALEAYQPHPP